MRLFLPAPAKSRPWRTRLQDSKEQPLRPGRRLLLRNQVLKQCLQSSSGVVEDHHKSSKAAEEKQSKALVKATSAWQNSKKAVKGAEEDLDSAKSLVEETTSSVAAKTDEIANDATVIAKVKEEAASAERESENLSIEYQNMCAGISSGEGDEGMTLPDQISKAHSDANNAEARAKQANMKIKHLTKTMKVSFLFLSLYDSIM